MGRIQINQPIRLVFCDKFPNGVLCSPDQYVALCKTMALDDFNCHTAVEVAADMASGVTEVILDLAKADIKFRRGA